MNIDTEFNVGDSVCYLSGDCIVHSTISNINNVKTNDKKLVKQAQRTSQNNRSRNL